MERRNFLLGSAAAALAVARTASARNGTRRRPDDCVTAAEDLGREHGVLRRLLGVYDEAHRRLHANEEVPAAGLGEAADLVRRYVEDYHEKQEEDGVFPRFERAGRMADLVAVLRLQHARGRALTDEVLRLSAPQAMRGEGRTRLAEALRLYVRMYRPHAAREDTVLFPALRPLVGEREYTAIGERFEAREQSLFGAGGFERTVASVARIEQAFGIADLASYTPPEPKTG